MTVMLTVLKNIQNYTHTHTHIYNALLCVSLCAQDDHKLTLDELHRKYGTDLSRVSSLFLFVCVHISLLATGQVCLTGCVLSRLLIVCRETIFLVQDKVICLSSTFIKTISS